MSTDPTPAEVEAKAKEAASKLWIHVVADVVAILTVGAFVALGRLDATYGVLFIALVIGLKLPSKGGGISTLVLPFAQMLPKGPS